METVEFQGWVIEIDREATVAAFAEVEASDTPGCGCLDCRRFGVVRSELLPAPALALFERLGADPRKEVEITSHGPTEGGRDIWEWFYVIVGHVVGRPYETKTSAAIPTTKLTKSLTMSFVDDPSLVPEPFRGRGPLVELNFIYSQPD